MIVCLCTGITEKQIRENPTELLGDGVCCGRCKPYADKIRSEALSTSNDGQLPEGPVGDETVSG